MKVIQLKNHNGNSEGSELDVTPETANYLVRCNVAVYDDGSEPKQVKAKSAKQTKQVKANLETK